MKRKGFTLVELLAVIVILAIILAIAIPSITNVINNAQASAYEKNEKMISKAARNYLAVNNSLIPSSTIYGNVVKLSDLVTGNYISGMKDVKDKSTTCDGYVVIKYMADTSFEYDPYIKCGSNYTTDKYDDSVYNASKVFLVETLVVAGGGGGGASSSFGATGAGGGGAGGLIYQLTVPVIATNYSIVVGTGGAGKVGHGNGTQGGNSTALGLTAIGGGFGAGASNTGGTGGSGGGGSETGGNNGGAATSGQGNAGGVGFNSKGGGGGGGFSTTGGSSTANGGNGGDGFSSNISGVSKYYAGGGGGGNGSTGVGGIGGQGGGGTGGNGTTPQNGTNGTVNTGGGGGGGSYGVSASGGNGGTGIVIIRYFGSAKATGGTITSVGGYTIHTFTTTGTSTFTVSSF